MISQQKQLRKERRKYKGKEISPFNSIGPFQQKNRWRKASSGSKQITDQSYSESLVQNKKETPGQMTVSDRYNTTLFTFPGENFYVLYQICFSVDCTHYLVHFFWVLVTLISKPSTYFTAVYTTPILVSKKKENSFNLWCSKKKQCLTPLLYQSSVKSWIASRWLAHFAEVSEQLKFSLFKWRTGYTVLR